MTENEKFTVLGSQLVEKVKQLIHEGNIRKVRLIHEGRTIIEIPLSIGAPAAVAVKQKKVAKSMQYRAYEERRSN